MAQGTKMVNLSIHETSGVDHPAHLHEGWLVMKAASTAEVLDALDALAPETPATAEATPGEKEGDMPEETPEAVVTDASTDGTPAVETSAEEFLKAAPEAVVKMLTDLQKSVDTLTKAAADADAAREAAEETLRKEREAAADAEAIEVAKAAYGALAIDVDVVAPALRALEATSPEVAKSITEALTAAAAQTAQTDGALFAEVGKAKAPAVDGDAFGQIQTLAKAKVEKGEAPDLNAAIAAVAVENPSLYAAYTTEQKGA